MHLQPDNSERDRDWDTLKLQVSCLPAKMDRNELWRYFGQFGFVRDIRFPVVHRIPDDQTIGAGYCTLELNDKDTKRKILQYNHVLGGRNLKVELFQRGNQLKDKNLIRNQTRLFLKRFPPGTKTEDVKMWLTELKVYSPECVFMVPSNKDQIESRGNRTLTFNVQCRSVQDSQLLFSHPNLCYHGVRIKVEQYQVSRPREEGTAQGASNNHGNTQGGRNFSGWQDQGMRSPYRQRFQFKAKPPHKSTSGGQTHAVGSQKPQPGSSSSIDNQYSSNSMFVFPNRQSIGLADRQIPHGVYQQHAGDPPGTVSHLRSDPKSQFSFPGEQFTAPEAARFGTQLRFRSTYCTNNATLLGENSANNLRFNIIALKKEPKKHAAI